jgi:hypothetical protein
LVIKSVVLDSDLQMKKNCLFFFFFNTAKYVFGGISHLRQYRILVSLSKDNTCVLEMVKGYPSRIPAIPWLISARGCGCPLPPEILADIWVSQGISTHTGGLGRATGCEKQNKKRKNKRKNGALTKKHGFCCAHCAADTFFN